MSQEELKRVKALIRKMSSAQEYAFVNKYEQGIKNLQQVLLESEAWSPKDKQLQIIMSKLRQKTKSLLESLLEMRSLFEGKELSAKPKIKHPEDRPLRKAHTEVPKKRGLPFGQKPFRFHYERKANDPRQHEQQYTNYNPNFYQAQQQEQRPQYREPNYDDEGRPGWNNNWNNLQGHQNNSADRKPQRQNPPPGQNYQSPGNDFGNYNYVAGFGKPPPPPSRSPPPGRKWNDNLRNKPKRPARSRKVSNRGDARAKNKSNKANKQDQKRRYDKPWLKGVRKAKDERTEAEKQEDEIRENLSPEQSALFDRVSACLIQEEMNVTFKDIIGHQSTKKQFTTSIMILKIQNHIKNDLLTPHSGILLYGPPGTGKTMLAKAFAKEKDFKFLCVNPSSIASKYRGDSEQMVSLLFQYARSYKNSILFIDEIDGILGSREEKEHEASLRIKNQLLIEIDGINNNRKSQDHYLMIVGATNHPWKMDNAAWRRFTSRIYIPLPGKKERLQFIDKFTSQLNVANDFKKEEFSRKIKGYSGDDIKKLFSKLMMNKFNELMYSSESLVEGEDVVELAKKVDEYTYTNKDFLNVLNHTKRSTLESDIKRYEEFTKVYGERDN